MRTTAETMSSSVVARAGRGEQRPAPGARSRSRPLRQPAAEAGTTSVRMTALSGTRSPLCNYNAADRAPSYRPPLNICAQITIYLVRSRHMPAPISIPPVNARAPTARHGRKFAGDPCPARGRRRHGGEQGLRRPAAGAAARTPSSTSAFRAIRAPTCPTAQALEGYDGVAITGSGLHVYDGGPAVTRQIELARAVLDAGTPVFGSCWGLQVLTVAAGGSVRKNPKGREIGFGRGIRLTDAGRKHPMYVGKHEVFNAPTVHLDEVETLAPGTTVLATNQVSDVQSAEIRCNGAVAWGVQYHPEYPLREIATIVRRIGAAPDRRGLLPQRRRHRDLRRRPRRARPQSGRQAAGLALRHQQERAGQEACAPARSRTGWNSRCCRPAPSADGDERDKLRHSGTEAKKIKRSCTPRRRRSDSPASAASTDRRGRGSTGNST